MKTVQANITGLTDGKFGWPSAKDSWKYIYDHYRDEADWFIRAEEDTFVVVPNLKEYLRDRDPTGLHYFGALMKNEDLPGGYNYVGSGESVSLVFGIVSMDKQGIITTFKKIKATY